MRRLLVVMAAVLATACATPPIRLSPSFVVGRARTYTLSTVASTAVDVQTLQRTENTVLGATSKIEVLSVSGDEATLRMTVTPTSFTRDGAPVQPPAAQTVELVVGTDGVVRRVLTVGGLPASIGGSDIQDLVPLIGIPLPTQRVRIGETLPIPVGSSVPQVYQGRIASVRRLGGSDCAIVELGTRRALSRQRTIEGQQVRLDGTESAHTTIAFAFRDGFPVEITTNAEGVFTIGGDPNSSVTITTNTRLRLQT